MLRWSDALRRGKRALCGALRGGCVALGCRAGRIRRTEVCWMCLASRLAPRHYGDLLRQGCYRIKVRKNAQFKKSNLLIFDKRCDKLEKLEYKEEWK